MATFEIVALDPTTPQLRAPGAADTYSLPRPIVGDNIFPQIVTTAATTYTLTAADSGEVLIFTSSTGATVTLPAAVVALAGFRVWIINAAAFNSANVTLSPASGTIDGYATHAIRRGEGVQLLANGTNWTILTGKKLRTYAENVDAGFSKANAVGDASVAVGSGAYAGSTNAFAAGTGAAAYGNSSAALGTYAYATGLYDVAIGCSSSGGGATAVTGSAAIAIGGAYASGNDSIAIHNVNNTSTYGAKGTQSIAMGGNCVATSSYGVAIAGGSANAGGAASVAIGYSCNTAVAAGGAFALGSAWNIGYGARSDEQDCFAFGDSSWAAQIKKYAFAGWGSSQGAVQYGLLQLAKITTDATPTVLTSNTANATTTNQLILRDGAAFTVSGLVVARQSTATGTQSAAWKVEALIRRETGVATTVLVASTVTAISNVPGWTIALSADTTNGGLAVTATGAAGTVIRWNAALTTAEVVY